MTLGRSHIHEEACHYGIVTDSYRTLVDDLNTIYALGSGTNGYYQTALTYSADSKCRTKQELLDLRQAISDCASHQGIALNPALPTTALLDDPKPYDYVSFVDTLRDNTITGTVTITDDPSLVDLANTMITSNPNSVDSVRTTAWSTTVAHEFTVTFTDQDHMRCFFNASGEIRLAASRTGGSATNQNTDWTNLLTNAGTVIFNSDGFTALTTTYVSIANFLGTGAYSANDWDIAVKTNTLTDPNSRGGKGNILTFRSQFNDNHVAQGAGPDSVDGTLTSSIDFRNVDGTFLTIAAPTFATITSL